MTYKDISQPNVENYKLELIEAITKKAQEIVVNPEILNRRELVNFLKNKLGIELKDGPYLKYLLKAAYDKNSFSPSLQKVIISNFIENEGLNSIYDPRRVEDNIYTLDLSKPDLQFDHFNLIKNQSQELIKVDGVGEIQGIRNEIDKLKPEATISISGESKVEAYREYTNKLKERYENMISTYEWVKNINISLISDYEALKNRLKIIREDLINLLIDLFGDQIKVQEPELFNFSDINWKTYDDLYPKLDLYYNTINERIATFRDLHEMEMQNILDSGSANIKSFLNQANKFAKSNQFASTSQIKGLAAGAAANFLVSGTMAMMRARSESKKVIAEMEVDTSRLKVDMNEDVKNIIQDIINLGHFHTNIRDVWLAQLNLFTQIVSNIIRTKIVPNYAKLIQNPIIKECRDLNISSTFEIREIEQELVDLERQMKYSESVFDQLSDLIESRKFEYNYLLELYPEEPTILAKIFSPFKSKKIYEETLKDWMEYCEPFVFAHEKLIQEKNDELELQSSITLDIDKLVNRKNELITFRKQNSSKIHEQVEINEVILKPILIDLLKEIKNISKNSIGPLEKTHSTDLLPQAT